MITGGILISRLYPFYDAYSRIIYTIGRKEYSDALDDLKVLVEKENDQVKVYLKIAEMYHYLNRYEEGLSYFNKRIRENPDNLFLIHGRGKLNQKFQNYNKALNDYLAIIRNQHNYCFIFKDVVDIYYYSGQASRADSLLSLLRGKYPENGNINYGLGYFYHLKNEWTRAYHYLNQSLLHNSGCLQAINNKIIASYYLNQFEEMFELCTRGAELAKQKRDIEMYNVFVANAGLACTELKHFKKALRFYKKDARLANRRGISTPITSLNISYLYYLMGKTELSDKYEMTAIKIAHENRDTSSLAVLYYNRCADLYDKSDYTEALKSIKESIEFAKSAGNKRMEGLSTWLKGNLHKNTGEIEIAIENYKQSLNVARQSNDHYVLGRCYNALGNVNKDIGNYLEALNFYEKALETAEKINNESDMDVHLENISLVYYLLGDYHKSLKYINRAIIISERNQNSFQSGEHYSFIARIYIQKGKYKKAHKYALKALSLLKKTGNKRGVSLAFESLSETALKTKNIPLSFCYLDSALNLSREIDVKYIIGNQLNLSGELFFQNKQYVEAENQYSEALRLGNQTKNKQILFSAEYGLGKVYAATKQIVKALHHFEKAVDIQEEIYFSFGLEEMRVDFQENNLDIYNDIMNFLVWCYEDQMNSDFTKKAFLYAEKARAQTFIQKIINKRFSITGDIDKDLKLREYKLRQELSILQKELRYQNFTKRERKEQIRRIETIESEIQKLKRKIALANPEYGNLFYPETPGINEIKEYAVGKNEAILEYYLTEAESYIWLITSENIEFRKLPNRGIIVNSVTDYLQFIENPVSLRNSFYDHCIPGNDLYSLILEPFESIIQSCNHLIIIPHGILNRLPFESLIVDFTDKYNPVYLVDQHKISYAPSSNALLMMKSQKNEIEAPKILAIGNPDYERISNNSMLKRRDSVYSTFNISRSYDFYSSRTDSLSSLPYSEIEINLIRDLFSEENCKIFTGEKADEEMIKNLNLTQFNYIHFATHSIIDERIPSRSGLVLTLNKQSNEDGILQLYEIHNLDLDADLVVLSSCQTGRGKLYQTEGIIGLARAFFYAGASSVIVSHWNINDRATFLFMKHFYSSLIQGNNTTDALRNAQLNMLQSEVLLYRHPYYWAPFILIGNH